MNAIEILGKIKSRREQMSDRYRVMDRDREIVYLNKYELKDTKGNKVEDAIHITMNDPAVYAGAVSYLLMTSKWQTQVECRNRSFKTHIIEQFFNDTDAEANEFLAARGEPELFLFLCNHVCLRSYIGCRFLFRTDEETGEIYPEYLPVDMRWTPYVYGRRGLAWVAPSFFMTPDEILADYPEAEGKIQGDKDIEVIDYWDSEQNILFVGDQEVWTQPNNLGYPPFVIQKPASGFMLRDKGYLAHEAESIFYLNRDLYDEWNRVVSIEQTLNMKLIKPSYQKESDDLSGPPAEYPDGVGKVAEVRKGEKYELLETKDINAAHRMANNVISGALQRGGVNNIDLGNVNQQVSAVWITEQAEIRTKILEPRLRCLAAFRQQLARMMIDQYIKGQYKTSLGKVGAKTLYDYADLGDPKTYSITFNLRSKSKKMEIANLAIAQGARGIVPEERIIRDIMEYDDPEGVIDQLNYERAEQADPALFFFRKAYSLAEKAEVAEGIEAERLKLESMRLTKKGCDLIRAERLQAQQGIVPEGRRPAIPKPNTNTLIPMMTQSLGSGVSLSPPGSSNATATEEI